MSFLIWKRILDYIFNTILLLWFFQCVPDDQPARRLRKLLALVPILSLMILYPNWVYQSDSLIVVLGAMVIRFIWRLFACTLYLRISKEVRWSRAVYFSCLYTLVYHCHLNILSIPVLEGIMNGAVAGVLTENVLFRHQLISHCVELLMLWLLRHGVTFREIRVVGSARAAVVAAVSACVIYAKSTIAFLRGTWDKNAVLVSLLLVLMHACLVLMIIFFERFMKLRRDLEEERIQEVSNAYIIKSMETWRAGQEGTRALAHDMKNHLLAIRRLAAGEDGKRVSAYVDEMLDSLNIEAQSVETGSNLLDGLIAEKTAEAARDGIELSVVLDSNLISFISDADQCTIFGNTLDNAIEASRQVRDPAARYITLRSISVAGQAVIVISNACARTPAVGEDALPETTKDPETHGIGLKNVRRVLERYGGILTLDTKTIGRFGLTMLIPIPKTDGRGER